MRKLILLVIILSMSCERLEVDQLQKDFSEVTDDIQLLFDDLKETEKEIDTIKLTFLKIDSILLDTGITHKLLLQ